MLTNDMYEAIKLAKEKIAAMNLDEILQAYLRFRGDAEPDRNEIAFMKVVEAGTFIDQTWRGEFCLSFEMPGTKEVMNMIRDNTITIMFKHPVDDEFEIEQTICIDLYKMIQDTPRAEKLKDIIGEFNMDGLLKALGGNDHE